MTATPGTTPCFSIVIPTRNRPGSLAACLAALARLDYPREQFEVLIVDDGGAATLGPLVHRWRDRLDVRLLVRPHAGVAASRNAGAAMARGDVLAFTDEDCLVEPDWLRALAACHRTAPDHAIGGRTLCGQPDNLWSAASQLLVDYLYGYYNADPARARFFAGNNLAVPTAGFWAAGGFDTRFGRLPADDREFCARWQQQGRPMRYVAAAVVRHAQALTPRSFCRQQFWYGRGAYHFRAARAARGESVPVEPPRFYTDLVRYPFARASGASACALAALLAVAQAANVLGFAWEARAVARRRATDARATGGAI